MELTKNEARALQLFRRSSAVPGIRSLLQKQLQELRDLNETQPADAGRQQSVVDTAAVIDALFTKQFKVAA